MIVSNRNAVQMKHRCRQCNWQQLIPQLGCLVLADAEQCPECGSTDIECVPASVVDRWLRGMKD